MLSLKWIRWSGASGAWNQANAGGTPQPRGGGGGGGAGAAGGNSPTNPVGGAGGAGWTSPVGLYFTSRWCSWAGINLSGAGWEANWWSSEQVLQVQAVVGAGRCWN